MGIARSPKNRHACLLTTTCWLLGCLLSSVAYAQTLGENQEVSFSSEAAGELRRKADELRDPVSIYEYMVNRTDYVPYWGSRSGAVNTFMGQRGNDVDLASAMIAMLRSQGTPARYAVGRVRIKETDVMNWIGVRTPSAAQTLLNLSGTPNVTRNTSGANEGTFEFEHVWVEAMVPYDLYRGQRMSSQSIDCGVTPARCTWISLDPSFKTRTYKNLDVASYSVMWDDSDYLSYYDSLKNNDSYRKNKSPLAILERDVLEWLRQSPATQSFTLEDVVDTGRVNEVSSGLLPASLPYGVVGAFRTYDSIEAHDQAASETRKWDRKLTVSVIPCNPSNYAGTVASHTLSLSSLSTERLVISHDSGGGNSISINLQFGRETAPTTLKSWTFGTVACSEGTKNFAVGTSFYVKLETDRDPVLNAPEAAIYREIVGGRYLVATGGETSNWSQVHRAAESLLLAARRYPIVYSASQPLPGKTCNAGDGSGCVAFIDTGAPGWDVNDQRLSDNPRASDELIGGLLETAAAQYYAKLREQFGRADGLMRIKTPILRFVGLVRSDYEVQYLKDGTAFAIQPNGMVIDMKGITTGTPVKMDSAVGSNSLDHFYFLGHIGSSLEHEVWQEITGFDAISTVRGIQLARAAGAELKTYSKTSAVNDRDRFLSDMGFQSAAPAPFSRVVRTIYATTPSSWSHPAQDGHSGFEHFVRAPVSPSSSTSLYYYQYKNDGVANFLADVDACENSLVRSPPSGSWFTYYSGIGFFVPTPGTYCGMVFPTANLYDLSSIRSTHASRYSSWRLNNGGNAYLDVYDPARGFDHASHVYRGLISPGAAYSTDLVKEIARSLHFFSPDSGTMSVKMTSVPVNDPNYVAEVYLQRESLDTGQSQSRLTFAISVQSK